MPIVKRTKKVSNLSKINQSPSSLSVKIKSTIERERERERAKSSMKVEIPPCSSCSQNQWQDTPTPSTDKNFDWNLDKLELRNQILTKQLAKAQEIYQELLNKNHQLSVQLANEQKKREDYQEQAQQLIFEQEGEINWYIQQNTSLKSQLKEWQDNEKELWKVIEYLEAELEQKERICLNWHFLQDKLSDCCQDLLQAEQEIEHFSQLATRYKKGKNSWEKQANLLDTELQTAITELAEQEELLDSKNTTIADLANQVKGLTKQLQQKTTTLSQKITFIQQQQQQIANLTHDKQNLQNWKDNHTCQTCSHSDYDTIKQERDTYQSQLATKDQKIAELEQIIQELRDKPPIQPINNSDKSDNSPQSEPNNFLIEKEEILSTIQQQKETIQELQNQLAHANSQEPQIIVKEIPVENLTTIQQLQAKLKNKEQTITQLHLIYLLLLGIGFLLLTYTARIIKKKHKLKSS